MAAVAVTTSLPAAAFAAYDHVRACVADLRPWRWWATDPPAPGADGEDRT